MGLGDRDRDRIVPSFGYSSHKIKYFTLMMDLGGYLGHFFPHLFYSF